MNAEILCFHSEKPNENLAQCEKILSKLSDQLGIENTYNTQTSADERHIAHAIKTAVGRSQIIFFCGNTEIIKQTLSDCFHLQPVEDDTEEQTDNTVLFPEGSNVFYDRVSGEYAFTVKISGKVIFALPQNHKALNALIDECVIPYFSKEFKRCLCRAQIRLFGIGDKEITEVLDVIKRKYPIDVRKELSAGIYTLYISACAKSPGLADSACSSAVADINSAFGYNVFEIGGKSLAEVTVQSLKRNELSISTAESCTGGMLSQTITSVSGSSDIMEIGICAYSNSVKRYALGVPKEVLDTFGAISKETAAHLAKGIQSVSSSKIGIGITGVAGPTSSEGKAVGTVYICLYNGEKYWIRYLNLPTDFSRDEIREYTTNTALDLVRRYIICLPEAMPGSCSEERLVALDYQPEPVFMNNEDVKKSDIVFSDENYISNKEPIAEISDEPLNSDEYYGIYHVDTDTSAETEIAEDNYDDFNALLVGTTGDYDDEESPKKVAQKKTKTLNILNFYKTGTPSQRIFKFVFTAVIALVLVGAILLSSYFLKIYRDVSQIDNAREIFHSLSREDAFETLSKENSDFKGWISIDGTEIDNPVYQTDNNKFYTSHNMKKQKSRYGSLFFDYRNTLSGDTVSQNIVVYGQNMDDLKMFGSLSKYQSLSYLNDNPVIKLSTQNGDSEYRIFAVLIMNAVKEDDNGYLFEFTRSSFGDASSFDSWTKELMRRNIYLTNMKVDYTDSLLTLVTTSDAFDNARLVVVAKEVTNEEGAVTFSVNPTPLHPQAWYDKHKATMPTFSDDNSTTYSEPENSEPENSEPENSEPENSEPENSEPENSKPENSEPENSKPENSEPENSQPENSQPENSQPENSEPENSAPENSEPENSAPEADTGSEPETTT